MTWWSSEPSASPIDPELEPHLRGTAPLTEYAWRYRYPGEPSHPEESEVRQDLDRARAVVSLIQGATTSRSASLTGPRQSAWASRPFVLLLVACPHASILRRVFFPERGPLAELASKLL